MQKQDRRSFLKNCLGWAMAAVVSRLLPDNAAAGWFSKGEKADEWLSLGKLADFPDHKMSRVTKAVHVADGKGVKTPKLVVLRKGEKAYVMSSKCTHSGCEVNLQGDGSYLCPCHESVFDRKGAVRKGPAKRPLPWYEVRITEGGEIQVNIGKTVEPPNAG